ncbi:MAG TPA: methylglyoxal synthase [Balneolales bacterium]|nr:methylglyoxal synthase [Balneolales bacterium]
MEQNRVIKMGTTKHIALIAHDNRKQDMVEWAEYNKLNLAKHELFATGTTGSLLEEKIGLKVNKFRSGPLGGDQQVGSHIADGLIDAMIFFWDPLSPHPHDVDVKALLRIAVVYNIPIACNRASADFIISSQLMDSSYDRRVINYEGRIEYYPGKAPEKAAESTNG